LSIYRDAEARQAARSYYASWGSRVGASLLDALAVVVIVAVGFVIGEAFDAPGLAAALAIFGYVAYFVVGHGSAAGQTLGKKALAIGVRRFDGRRLGYARALWRFVAQSAIGLIPLINLLNLLSPRWDADNQCWHDKLAGTIVIRA
jgi:serine/threonine-protein kinase